MRTDWKYRDNVEGTWQTGYDYAFALQNYYYDDRCNAVSDKPSSAKSVLGTSVLLLCLHLFPCPCCLSRLT